MARQTFSSCRIAGVLVLLVVAIAGSRNPVRACTTFCMLVQDRVVLGMNTDWMVPDGFLLVNKRGVERTAMVDENPARWTSRFGSVSFNQYGRDFPMGGMNEAGLVVENLWLDETHYPEADARSALGVLSWVQYQLDTAATVADVIESDEHLRITSIAPLHFFIADRHGEAATIEFIDGRMVTHSGEALPVAALTNSTYRALLQAFRSDRGRRDTSSPGRFATAARRIEDYSPSDGDPVSYAFETLRQARQSSTQWSAVYEIDHVRLHFRTRSNPRTRSLDLAGLDFSCSSPVVGIDLHADLEGDVRPHLTPFSPGQNLALVRASYAKTPFLADRPESDARKAARHAETARCLASGP